MAGVKGDFMRLLDAERSATPGVPAIKLLIRNPGSGLSVDLAPMPHPRHRDHPLLIIDSVDHAIVTDHYAPEFGSLELDRAGWAWSLGEARNGGVNADEEILIGRTSGEAGEIPRGRGRDVYAVRAGQLLEA